MYRRMVLTNQGRSPRQHSRHSHSLVDRPGTQSWSGRPAGLQCTSSFCHSRCKGFNWGLISKDHFYSRSKGVCFATICSIRREQGVQSGRVTDQLYLRGQAPIALGTCTRWMVLGIWSWLYLLLVLSTRLYLLLVLSTQLYLRGQADANQQPATNGAAIGELLPAGDPLLSSSPHIPSSLRASWSWSYASRPSWM